MAEKESKTTKTTKTNVKTATKPVATKSATDAKKSATSSSTAKTAKKSASSAKSASTAKSSASKPATSAKSTAKSTVDKSDGVKQATSAKKPSASTAPKSKQTAEVKSAPAKSATETKTAEKADKQGAKATATGKGATETQKAESAKTKATAEKQTKSESKKETKPIKSAEEKKQNADSEIKKADEVKKTSKKAEPAKESKKSDVKPEKTKKDNSAGKGKSKKTDSTVVSADGTATLSKTQKIRTIIIVATSIILAISICLGLVLGLRACNADPLAGVPFTFANKGTTLVGYSSSIVDTVKRYKPVEGVHDGGLETGYPKYGYTLNLDNTQKSQILRENNSLNCKRTSNTGGVYEWMDKDGFLYNGTVSAPEPYIENGSQKQLYKHTGSIGLYYGDVSDDEVAVVKNFTFRPRTYNSYYNVTGLYAPAGEVIKIQLSEEDMNKTGGLVIHIGQALYNGQANNIWSARNFNRMPVILNTMNVTKDTATLENGVYTAYVGSFLGGPIYVRSESVTFSMTISGGVNYAHFILGVTTEEEYNEYAKSSAPMFDLEVWESGVLHSGPMLYAKNFSYQELYKAAVLWEKISIVSTNVVNQGIVFLYDPFVAAGAAVAFPGRRSVNCPTGWMANSLNYNAFVTSGAWGNMHEYHHNFQNFGVGYTGEVTNNALNLVSYSLFTKISSARQLASYGGAGLSGWNCYTSATWALNRVNSGEIGSTNGLAVYSTLLHNFGQDAFIKSTKASGAAYFNKWANNVHYDFTYYASQIGDYTGNIVVPAATDYPTFVPVSSVYQTGRSYMYDGEKRYIETMQPYVIPYGKEFTIDLNPYKVNSAGQYESGSIVIGNGFKYSIKSIDAGGASGAFTKVGEGIYKFKPNSGALNSGKIYVTLEITTESGEHTHNGKPLDDVDLVLEFQQSHETNKAVLEKTVYTFDDGKNYSNAVEAYNSGYAGYKTVENVDNANFSQNSNTDVWLYGDPNVAVTDPTKAPYIVNNNQIFEIKGKLYFPEAGKYRIYLRGRVSCALYISRDGGKTYTLAGQIQETLAEVPKTSAQFRFNDENTYVDVEVKAEEWIYFKEVLITVRMGPNAGTASYIGLGLGSWTEPMYTTKEKFVDKDENIVGSVDDPKYHHTETLYFNSDGQEVSAEEASKTDPVAPTDATYVTAYRQSYEFVKEFTSEYFYTKNYNYNYDNTLNYSGTPTLVSVSHEPWDSTRVIDYLLDGKTNTSYHSIKNNFISKDNPFELVVDLGEVFKANHVTFYGYHNTHYAPGSIGMPISFTLYGSLDGEEYFEILSRSNMSYDTRNVTLEFDPVELRYYKLHVTLTDNARYFAMSEIKFYYHTLTLKGDGNNHNSPDKDIFKYTGSWRTENVNANYGHVYIGDKGAEMTFKFEGTRFLILSSKYFGRNFEVYIDGNIVGSEYLNKNDNDFSASYLSPELSDGTHNVLIKCKSEGNIDSIVFFKAQETE